MLFDINDLNKIYGKEKDLQVHALKSANIQIKEKDFIAIIGPSGSGKTTFLNLLAGLVHPTSGTIVHKGKSLEGLSLEERTAHRLNHMGFVFQDYQLLPVLTAKENVEFPLQLRGVKKEIIEEKVDWALTQVGIAHLKNRYPKEMSGGQQQRISIARAIVGRPSIILADEPTANLDSKTAYEIIHLFKELNSKFNLTFIFSTHDQRLIDEVKTIYHIKDGELAPSEVVQ